MAKTKTTATPTASAATQDVTHAVSPQDVATLKAIPVDGFTYLSPEQSTALVTLGYVQVNDGMIQGDTKATRLTEAGKSFLSSLPAEATAPAAAAAPKFEATIVDNFEMPAARRVGPKRSETFPFSKLEVGQAFFIPATAEKPNPEKTFASTVTSARNRFANVKQGETRTNRRGKAVPVLEVTRDFQIRRLEDGAPFKQPGVAGAVIKRIA